MQMGQFIKAETNRRRLPFEYTLLTLLRYPCFKPTFSMCEPARSQRYIDAESSICSEYATRRLLKGTSHVDRLRHNRPISY
jgi:hypothetical protein